MADVVVETPADGAREFPRLPVLGWATFRGKRHSSLPSVLAAGHRRYTISGRAAIAHALHALKVMSGDRVLVPTYHCPTMVSPVIQVGARPLFFPITASGEPNMQWLSEADLSGVRAMLAAHYFGLPLPMAAVRRFCDSRGIALIEDCAHSFFGVSDDRPVGGWGDVAIASLTKFFPVSEGGLIVSNSLNLQDLRIQPRGWYGELRAAVDAIELGVRHRRFPGLNATLGALFRVKDILRSRRQVGLNGKQEAPTAGTERLMSSSRPALAAKCISRLAHCARIVALRRSNYARLSEALADLSAARPLYPTLPPHAAPYVFPLHVDDPQASYQKLRATGIPIFCWDEVWPGTPRIPGDFGFGWSAQVFQLGCHQDLSSDDIDVIANRVRAILDSGPKSRMSVPIGRQVPPRDAAGTDTVGGAGSCNEGESVRANATRAR